MATAVLCYTAACGKDGVAIIPNSGDTSHDPAKIDIVVGPDALTVTGNTVTRMYAETARVNYTGDVNYSLINLPSGVTSTTSVDGNTATFTISAGSGAVVGNYPVTVHATGTGIAAVDVAFTLKILAATGHTATFSMNPAAISVTRGVDATGLISIARNGLSAEEVLVVENVPAYMAAYLSPNPIPDAGTTLRLTSNSLLPTGTYHLFVRGRAIGETDVVLPFTVTVH